MFKKTIENYKHYVMPEIGLIKGYTLLNETNESDGIIINHIQVDMNMESETGQELYNNLKGKFQPDKIKAKCVKDSNYIYTETEQDGIIRIEIKILTNKSDPEDRKAKKLLISKINKYT